MSDQTDIEMFKDGQRRMLLSITDIIYYKDFGVGGKKVDAYKLALLKELSAYAEMIKIPRGIKNE